MAGVGRNQRLQIESKPRLPERLKDLMGEWVSELRTGLEEVR